MGNKILGLDLGTNSIGWALVDRDDENKTGSILGMGSRIIPMAQDMLSDFAKGSTQSSTAERTRLRGVRRLRERHLLRRERLHRVLNVMGILPEHYAKSIDFTKRFGQFFPNLEPKFSYDIEGFLFTESYNAMLQLFQEKHPDLRISGKKIPQDWTVYYLRKKALTERISDQELAWLLLHFNQKRGYYQLRGEIEEDENPLKTEEFYSLTVVKIEEDSTQKKGDKWYSLHLNNGWIYRRQSKVPMDDWLNKTRDFIVTTEFNEDGTIKTDKDGKEKRSFRAPKEGDWTLQKKKTESEIHKTGKTVGTFIFDAILENPIQKIRGKYVRTIERSFYKDEMIQILKTQCAVNERLMNSDLLTACVKELYPNNLSHQAMLLRKDFVHLLVNDIIFYQRPLRSQKSLISDCPFEKRSYIKDGVKVEVPIKTIPKSHPLYEEFRLWQWIDNLKIYNDDDQNVTEHFIGNASDRVALYEYLLGLREIKQDAILKFFLAKTGIKGKELNVEIGKYRWNYAFDKLFPAAETRYEIAMRLKKVPDVPTDFLTEERLLHLWHIIYSVTDKPQFERAMTSYALKNNLDEERFVDQFKRIKPYKSDYGAYSEKAIKRLLPLMRSGTYWNESNIHKDTLDRIDKLQTAEFDPTIEDRVREKVKHLKTVTDFQGLPLWMTSYVVYNRHSEGDNNRPYKSIDDFKHYIKAFKQHSLRNPIVEQIVLETLRTVHDIWKEYGNGEADYFSEIHVELGRDLKNPANVREKMSKENTNNENTNLRLKLMLAELSSDPGVANVRPFSPYQLDVLKIYEDGALNSGVEIPDDIEKISKLQSPSKNDITRYKCWLEQNYRSPYTGNIIPMSRLFTADYEIEHVIPQSRYFDNSFSNKVICEAAVNKLKENKTGMEFILKNGNDSVEIYGKPIRIFSVDEYTDFVKKHYAKNPAKRQKLLSEEVPEKMISRQLNDMRYISKFVAGALSNIVRADQDDDGQNSKNFVPGNGKITTALKQDWGLNSVWNALILPRFERLNALTNSSHFTAKSQNHQSLLPTVPLELSKNFQKKRIDHRHHAMDALVIACATRNHVNYSSNLHGKDAKTSTKEKEQYRLELRSKLCKKVATDNEGNAKWTFNKPWPTFTEDAKAKLTEIVVSFKQNVRVINKSTNFSQKWVRENGQLVKRNVRQEIGQNWAIRKSLHKDTVSGKVTIREIKQISLANALTQPKNLVDKALKKHVHSMLAEGKDTKQIMTAFKSEGYVWNDKSIAKVDVYDHNDEYTASRVNLDMSFNLKKIESVTDSGIQKILRNHLKLYEGLLDEKGKEVAPETRAFSPEGIDEMNKNLHALNGGKPHQAIYKVRTFETLGNKFKIGETGQKATKYVEAAKGTNLFFAIYVDESGKRAYETIPLHEVIERQKQGKSPVAEVKFDKEKELRLLFYLSPNDLVYLPADDQTDQTIHVDRIYKMISSSGNQCFFVPHAVAVSVVDKLEFSALNKMEKSIDGKMIKAQCWKLTVDRMGKIVGMNT